MPPTTGRCPKCGAPFDDHVLKLTPPDPPVCPKGYYR